MVSDPSALMLLKYGFPATKVPRHYICETITVTNWYLERGGGGLHMLALLKLLMLMFYILLL